MLHAFARRSTRGLRAPPLVHSSSAFFDDSKYFNSNAPSGRAASERKDELESAQSNLHRHRRIQSSTTASTSTSTGGTSRDTDEKRSTVVLYKGPHVKLFRVVVRFKLMQLFSIGAVSTPLVLFFGGGAGENIENVSATTQMLFAAASAFGAVGCAFALQEFANRYVGELALVSSSDEKKHWLRISSMDFWGNRVETVVKYPDAVEAPMRNVPESSYGEIAEATFLPLDVYLDEEKMEKKQFMVSLRHGKLLEKKTLLDVLSGK